MIGALFRYSAWALAAVAAAALTVAAFSAEHFSRFAHGSIVGRDAAPYIFFASGMLFLGSFLALGFRHVRELFVARSAAAHVDSWPAMRELAEAQRLGSVGQAFVKWAERQRTLCGAVAPDCEGWLSRQSDIANQSGAIRMVAGVLIVLGIVFTFEAIASSAAQLSKAVQVSVADVPSAQGGAKGKDAPSVAQAASDREASAKRLEETATRLQHEIAMALDPLARAFGANLNGILFTIDLLVMLALLQLLDSDAQRLLREFVLDHAEPLLLAEYATSDPTHALMREMSDQQAVQVAHIATQVVEQLDKILTRSNAATAAEIATSLATISEQLDSTGEAVEEGLTRVVDATVLASTKAAELTAKKLTATVSAEFKAGLDGLNAVISRDVPAAFATSASALSAAVATAGNHVAKAAAEAATDAMRGAKEVGVQLAEGAAAVARSADGMAAALDGAAADAGEKLVAAARASASELRSASATAREDLGNGSASASAQMSEAAADARLALREESRLAATALEELRQRLEQTATELNDAADALFASAEKHSELTDSQARAAQAFVAATTALAGAASHAHQLIGPVVAAADRVATAVADDSERLESIADSLASADAGLRESAAALGPLPGGVQAARAAAAAEAARILEQLRAIAGVMERVVGTRRVGIEDEPAGAGRDENVRLKHGEGDDELESFINS